VLSLVVAVLSGSVQAWVAYLGPAVLYVAGMLPGFMGAGTHGA
jgi:hypothetical protein